MKSSGALCITTRNYRIKQQASVALALNMTFGENCCSNDASHTLGMFRWKKATHEVPG